ncbi:hypothetical protein [Pseudomonas nunensis]|uniref:PAAR motif-containing protein n=1 Tax=Pseudomonas nunensis TaxID=2961896 RepID=A0ABY5EFJ7_9PSED|nr:hypothetical protein [Pseudomonas nunensis]KPN88139.1 hypothetical protein AL066_28315 [Pseudomonas nunensis]MCL5224578.1 hypothetical protein [Pseudomonas nunensis]UTO14192.1 hypothetical protein NK667_29235 [Pseudomonas nunensis]
MVDPTEKHVSLTYRYYYDDELIIGEVVVLKGMQFESGYVQGLVATKIAESFKEQGKSVLRNGQAVIGGTSNVDKTSGVCIHVDGPFDSFTLETYAAGKPISLVKDW